MLYNTGTIAVNGNTATGTGTNWTAPASQIRVGQTLFVLSNPVQMFQITAINSATSLTVTPAASPALSGQKYGILVTDSLSVDGLAQSMSQLIKDYDENIGAWETFATTSANQSITVTINGARVTIPAIGKLAQKGSNGAIPIGQGGTGATNAADARSNLGFTDGVVPVSLGGTGSKTASGARTNLGLGDSATRSVGSGSNDVMGVGAFGLGITLDGASTVVPLGGNETTGFGYWNSSGGGVFPGQWQVGLNIKGGGAVGGQFILNAYAASPRAIIRCRNSTNPNAWAAAELYTTANTTKSSDGTLKAASPVARIVKSREETERADVAEDGFSWCGCGTANSEAEGISLSRLDVGVYLLTGSAGLASEGWQLLPPMDPGGMGELGVVEADQTENDGLIIRLFKRKYMLSDEGEIIKTKGEPMDVPANSWIDVRLDMHDDSLFNQLMGQVFQS